MRRKDTIFIGNVLHFGEKMSKKRVKMHFFIIFTRCNSYNRHHYAPLQTS